MGFDIGVDSLSLRGTGDSGILDLMQEEARLRTGSIVVHPSTQQVFVARTVVLRKMCALQVVVDDNDGVVSHLQEVSHRAVGCRFVGDLFLLHNGKTGMDAHRVEELGIVDEDSGIVIGKRLLVFLQHILAP